MDNLIALFREQTALIAAHSQRGMSTVAAVQIAPQAEPVVDATASVRSENEQIRYALKTLVEELELLSEGA